jgi:hypothetical protein
MSTDTAKEPVNLTPGEWCLIAELLEREQRTLLQELHHTRTRDMRSRLHQRLTEVELLLARTEIRDRQ